MEGAKPRSSVLRINPAWAEAWFWSHFNPAFVSFHHAFPTDDGLYEVEPRGGARRVARSLSDVSKAIAEAKPPGAKYVGLWSLPSGGKFLWWEVLL